MENIAKATANTLGAATLSVMLTFSATASGKPEIDAAQPQPDISERIRLTLRNILATNETGKVRAGGDGSHVVLDRDGVAEDSADGLTLEARLAEAFIGLPEGVLDRPEAPFLVDLYEACITATPEPLPPALQMAVVSVESGWRASIIGPAPWSCIGLGQIHFETWRERFGLQSREQLLDPALNLKISAQILSDALAFNVDGEPGRRVRDTLTTYAAGAGAVARYRRDVEHGVDSKLVQNIPLYWEQVGTRFRAYHELYGDVVYRPRSSSGRTQ